MITVLRDGFHRPDMVSKYDGVHSFLSVNIYVHMPRLLSVKCIMILYLEWSKEQSLMHDGFPPYSTVLVINILFLALTQFLNLSLYV